MKTKKLAFFDFDGTLYNGFSVTEFILFLTKELQNKEARKEIRTTLKNYISGKISYKEGVQLAIEILARSVKNLTRVQSEDFAKEFWQKEKRIIFPWAGELIKYLKEGGYKVYLVTGTPEFVVSPAADILGINERLTTKLEIIDNTYTSKVQRILHSDDKRDVVKEIITISEPKKTIGFGDSTGDIGMLELMDKAFVVNLHQEVMKEISKKNGWIIIEETNNILKQVQETIE